MTWRALDLPDDLAAVRGIVHAVAYAVWLNTALWVVLWWAL